MSNSRIVAFGSTGEELESFGLWIKVWSHVNMGKIFDTTGQRERALNEYRIAEETKDNTRGAQDEVAKYRLGGVEYPPKYVKIL